MKTIAILHREQKEELEQYRCTGRYCNHETSSKHYIVDGDVLKDFFLSQIDLMIEIVESSRESNACYKEHKICTCNKFETALETDAYNTALSDHSILLQAQRKLIEEQG